MCDLRERALAAAPSVPGGTGFALDAGALSGKGGLTQSLEDLSRLESLIQMNKPAMPHTMKEARWKVHRRLHLLALERLRTCASPYFKKTSPHGGSPCALPYGLFYLMFVRQSGGGTAHANR